MRAGLAYVMHWLNDPVVQSAIYGGVAPFIVGLIVILALRPVRLGGLAALAAFLTAVYLLVGFALWPLTAARKILLLGMAAAAAGVLADFAFKPTRTGGRVLALAGAAAVLWVLWPGLARRPAAEAWLQGGTAAVSVAWMIGYSQARLSDHGVRAGAAGLALGLGVGIAVFFGASNTFSLFAIALAAASGAFLLVQLVAGKESFAGATYMFTVTLTAGLLAAGAVVLAKLPWYTLPVLALIPVAAGLPAPPAPLWLQAGLRSLYGLGVAAVACFLAWRSAGGIFI